MKTRFLSLFLAIFFAGQTLAQWQDQSFVLKPGWNAVYFHVDASHATINQLITGTSGIPIDGIWLWKPALAPDRYILDPQIPSDPNIDWAYWKPNPGPSDTLARLIANAAYLVHNSSSSNYTWTVRGKPMPPHYSWTSKGVNFIGFSSREPNPPVFTTFLSPVPTLRSQGFFYRYDDGNNDLTPSEFKGFFPTTPVKRGTAYWIKTENNFNRYFGAFDCVLQNSSGILFREDLSSYSVRLRNNTAASLTIQLQILDSATPPAGQPAIFATPPLLMRGELNAATLTYGHTNLQQTRAVTLAPAGQSGSELEVTLGVDRSAMTATSGTLYAGILRLTDPLGYSQYDFPVSANVAAKGGLWVGNANVTHVRHSLNNYQRDSGGNPVLSVLTTNGARYVVTNVNTSLGKARRAFPLRLIVHHDSNAAATYLMERIYSGYDGGSNFVVTATESRLNKSLLHVARRISAPHLPWTSDNAGWRFGTGNFSPGGTMSVVVNLGHNDHASNPFLHTYHPDHDNLNAEFKGIMDRGEESYDVERRITLQFLPLPSDFGSLTAAGSRLAGNYNEDIIFKGRGSDQRLVQTAGTFQLTRISPVDTLTR